MHRLHWEYDEITEYWAKKLVLPIKSQRPALQYGGGRLWEENWKKYITSEGFPGFCRYPNQPGALLSSPSNIINCFKDGKVLEALALTVSWGGMTRATGKIYKKPKNVIENALINCYSLIEVGNNVEDAWNRLIHELSWGNVLTSKTLHFLTRALGYELNPPVPIDTKVMVNEVWPKFKEMAMGSYHRVIERLPYTWRYSSWRSYNCYITAINCWANIKGWTTTQMENTIFEEYYPEK